MRGTADGAGIPRSGCSCRMCLDPDHHRTPSWAIIDAQVALDSPHAQHDSLQRWSASPGDPDLPPADQWQERGDYRAKRWFVDGIKTAVVLDICGPSGRVLWAPRLDFDPAHGLTSSHQWAEAITSVGPVDTAILGGRGRSAAHALARLRETGIVQNTTQIALVGLGHHDSPERINLLHQAWGVSLPADGDRLQATDALALDRIGWAQPGPGLPRRTLVLGGMSSGKSIWAEDLLAASARVKYIATGLPADRDTDAQWYSRVMAHQQRRPYWWKTVETLALVDELQSTSGCLLIDSLGAWLAQLMDACGAWEDADGWEADIEAQIEELVHAWNHVSVPVVAVSDEVGLGGMGSHPSQHLFATWLGRLNARLAESSEQVLLVVAGRATAL